MLPLAMPLNDDTVSPGFLGFGVFVALLVALVFLIRSMNKQMKRIQAPREADLKQQEWERAQAAKAAGGPATGTRTDAKSGTKSGPKNRPDDDTGRTDGGGSAGDGA